MALPENRIKKIKLPDNTEYEIVPEKLQRNSYEVSIPWITQDSQIKLKSAEKVVTGNMYAANSMFFGEIKPWNNVITAWQAKLLIEISKNSPTYDSKSFSAVLTIGDKGGTYSTDSCTILAENNSGSTPGYVTSLPISNHRVYLITKQGLNANYGHILGFDITNTVYTNLKVTITILETVRCDVVLWDTLTASSETAQAGYLNTQVTCPTTEGLQSSEEIGGGGVAIDTSSAKTYLVGQLASSSSSSEDTLYKNTGLYAQSGSLTAYHITANTGITSKEQIYITDTYGLTLENDEGGETVFNPWEIEYSTYNEETEEETRYSYSFPKESGTIKLEPNWRNYFNVSTQYQQLRFGQIKPDSFYDKAWSITYEILFNINSRVNNTKYDSAESSIVTISSKGTTYSYQRASITAINNCSPVNVNSGQNYTLNKHCVDLITKAGVDLGYGHPVGFYSYGTFSTFNISIRILKTQNCTFEFYDNLTPQNSTPSYSYYYTSDSVLANKQGLVSENIDTAADTVRVYGGGNYSTYYVTGSLSTSTGQNLYTSNSVYLYNNRLYSANGFYSGTTYYSSGYIYPNYGNNQQLIQNKSGTIALTSDIQNIEIVDLTSVEPGPVMDECYIGNVTNEDSLTDIAIYFPKGFLLTSISVNDSGNGLDYDVDLSYDEPNDEITVDDAVNCVCDGYWMVGESDPNPVTWYGNGYNYLTIRVRNPNIDSSDLSINSYSAIYKEGSYEYGV